MTKPRPEKTVRKRVTRAQLDERLSIPLGPKTPRSGPAAEAVPEVDAAARQRIRDRAGD